MCETILKNNINQTVISADHYEKETYEILRKNSNFETIVKNVDTLYNLRKSKYPNSITEIRISGVDANKELMTLHKTKKELTTEKTPNQVTNQAVFVGSTAELQKLLKAKRGE